MESIFKHLGKSLSDSKILKALPSERRIAEILGLVSSYAYEFFGEGSEFVSFSSDNAPKKRLSCMYRMRMASESSGLEGLISCSFSESCAIVEIVPSSMALTI